MPFKKKTVEEKEVESTEVAADVRPDNALTKDFVLTVRDVTAAPKGFKNLILEEGMLTEEEMAAFRVKLGDLVFYPTEEEFARRAAVLEARR